MLVALQEIFLVIFRVSKIYTPPLQNISKKLIKIKVSNVFHKETECKYL